MPDISTARGIARNLGADLSLRRLQVLHQQLTEYMRTAAGSAVESTADFSAITGTVDSNAALRAEFNKRRHLGYFLGE